MEFIASGSYGMVYLSDRKIYKRISLDTQGTINDIIFLRKLTTTGHSPILYDIRILEDNNIAIVMENVGRTISAYNRLVDIPEKYLLLQWLFCELIDILTCLKKNNIIHMDITSSNLCIDMNNSVPKIKLIDYGFAIKKSDKVINLIGTYIFADPSYLLPKIHDYTYDIFSVAMVMFYWLSYEDFKTMCEEDRPFTENLFNTVVLTSFERISKLINDDMVNILKKMLVLDEHSRISLELLNSFRHTLSNDNIYVYKLLTDFEYSADKKYCSRKNIFDDFIPIKHIHKFNEECFHKNIEYILKDSSKKLHVGANKVLNYINLNNMVNLL